MKRLPLSLLIAAAAASFAGAASAHVSLEYQVAPAGSHYKATFKIGHGCAASPTRQISVAIPAGVKGARPMPKPGWTLEMQRAPQASPGGGSGEVVRITWTARTPADMLASEHYDEFVLAAQVPEQPGPVYWPLTQVCETGRHDWVEVPRPGQNPAELKSPAPLLEILPGAGGGHRH